MQRATDAQLMEAFAALGLPKFLRVMPAQWRTVLETAIALRGDRSASLPAPPQTLWREAIDVSTWLIDDAHQLIDRAS